MNTPDETVEPQAPEQPAEHEALPRPRASGAALVLAVLAVGYTLWATQDLILPVLLAMFFALVGNPILRVLQRLRIPRFLTVRELRSVARTYLARPQDARESYASPLRAASHRGLPPAVILTAEYDPLRGDGDAYGAALRRAGVDASVVRYQGVTHDTPIFTGVLPAARRWHDDVVAALRRLHA